MSLLPLCLGYKLDKKHTFCMTSMAKFDDIMATPDEWAPPAPEEYDEQRDNLQSWLLNTDGNDQAVLRFNDCTSVAFNGRSGFSTVEERQVHARTLCWWESAGESGGFYSAGA